MNDVRETVGTVPVLRRLPDVFSETLGLVKGFYRKVKIRRTAMPVQHKLRRLPLTVRDNVKAELDRFLSAGVIEPVEASERVSGMVVVAKKDGRVRICVNLREVNQNIIPDVFPIPHLADLLTQLKGARWFTKLDATSAYHQVELHEDSRDLTAFITPWGLFRYRRVCFGLASAPAAFQRMMTAMLEGAEGVLIYLDDVLIFGSSKEEHDRRVDRVLRLIRAAEMTLNAKCVLGVNEVDFVGFTISEKGVRPCKDNLDAIKKLVEPSNTGEIGSVLGMAGFYLRCVPNFADMVEPMRRLLRSGVKFEWKEEQREAFREMKTAILRAGKCRTTRQITVQRKWMSQKTAGRIRACRWTEPEMKGGENVGYLPAV